LQPTSGSEAREPSSAVAKVTDTLLGEQQAETTNQSDAAESDNSALELEDVDPGLGMESANEEDVQGDAAEESAREKGEKDDGDEEAADEAFNGDNNDNDETESSDDGDTSGDNSRSVVVANSERLEVGSACEVRRGKQQWEAGEVVGVATKRGGHSTYTVSFLDGRENETEVPESLVRRWQASSSEKAAASSRATTRPQRRQTEQSTTSSSSSQKVEETQEKKKKRGRPPAKKPVGDTKKKKVGKDAEKVAPTSGGSRGGKGKQATSEIKGKDDESSGEDEDYGEDNGDDTEEEDEVEGSCGDDSESGSGSGGGGKKKNQKMSNSRPFRSAVATQRCGGGSSGCGGGGSGGGGGRRIKGNGVARAWCDVCRGGADGGKDDLVACAGCPR
jgi:hypothetical protein